MFLIGVITMLCNKNEIKELVEKNQKITYWNQFHTIPTLKELIEFRKDNTQIVS
jgi:hypothetical protein